MYIGGYGGVDWNSDTYVSKKLFAPRLGIAYRLGKHGVLRTAYGITFDPYNLGRLMRNPYPAVIQLSVQGPNYGAGRLEGPGMVNVDLGIFRAFKISEGNELQFRAEGFNISNTPHFGNPSNSASDMTFNKDGSVKSYGNFMSIRSAMADQRTFRFGLRFSF